MKKQIFILLLIVTVINTTKAQEFWVKKFIYTPKDITARISPRTDDNSQKCAIIKIHTNLRGLKFDCNMGFCGDDIPYDNAGIYKLYVSPGEKRIMIQKEGFIPLEYIIEDYNIKSLETYKMTLTQKGGYIDSTQIKKFDFVKIYSKPSGANVYIEGELKGTTPYEELIEEGNYIYLIRKNKYYDTDGNINVEQGNTKEINAKLKPKFGNIEIKTTPTGADISINNKPTGKQTPTTFDFKEQGKYDIMLQKYKYKTEYKTITLQEGVTEKINITLKKDYASVTIKTTPERGANIEIDDKEINKTTPYTITELSSGEHKIRVTKKMYKPAEKTINVTAGQAQTTEIIMQPTFTEITINTTPEDAKIYIDGNYKSTGKYTGKLNEGMHIIEIKKEKYKNRKENITIKAGTPKTIKYTMQARKGNIAITTSPTKAEIYINGTHKGKSPKMIYDLIIGDYNIEAKKTGYATTTKKIIITEGQITQTKLILQSGLKVTINSKPQGANIYIGDSYKGKAPQNIDLSFGEHTVKLTGTDKDKYKDTEHTINIRQNGKTTYTLPLKQEDEDYNMVFIKGGTFQMGSNNGYEREKPVHTVTVSDFYIGKYEVTQKQWEEIMGNNPSYFKGDNLPVEQVSWNDIQEFIKKLNRKTGKKYRLPTEAEWEYACRAGTTTPFNTGNCLSTNQANYDGNYPYKECSKGTYREKTTTVGSFSPNAWGIYNMHGNVYEWCQDVYKSDFYSQSKNATNPIYAGSGSRRVIRGGSWNGYSEYCRSADRSSYAPSYSNDYIGFRLAETN